MRSGRSWKRSISATPGREWRMLSAGISARTARLNGTPSMAIRGGILSDENGRRSGAREVAGEARPGQRKSSQASAQRRRAGSLETSNFRRPPPRGRPVERTGAPTHEQGERSPVAVRKKCLADGWPEGCFSHCETLAAVKRQSRSHAMSVDCRQGA